MRKLCNQIRLLARDKKGAAATEYGLLVVFVALAMAAGAIILGGGLKNLFTDIGNTLDSVSVSPIGGTPPATTP